MPFAVALEPECDSLGVDFVGRLDVEWLAVPAYHASWADPTIGMFEPLANP